jgi:peptidoglycan/xylan/chitin deacetylase (PgdA/CDA1 family)
MLDSIRFMKSDEVAQIRHHGIELGAHTVNHAILSSLDGPARKHEIVESVMRVRQWSDVEAVPFAYPNGKLVDFSDEDIAILRTLKVPAAVTTVPGLNTATDRVDIYRLFRLAVSRRVNRDDFEAMVSGLYDKGRRWQAP